MMMSRREALIVALCWAGVVAATGLGLAVAIIYTSR
jgi:methylthioribose-1-phosphate isomerase